MRFALLILVIAVAATAQEQSPLSRPSTQGAAGRHNGFDSMDPSGSAGGPPVYLRGKVMLDDGSPPPEPAIIERHCDGKLFSDAFTDSKGRFSFRPGGDATMAIVTGNVGGFNHLGRDPFGGAVTASDRAKGQIDLTGCRLIASLAGFTSSHIALGRHSAFDDPDVGVIVLRRLGGSREWWVSETALRAPGSVVKLYEQARRILAAPGPDVRKAIAKLETATQRYDDYADAWTLLGRLYASLADLDGAKGAYQAAITADHDHLPAHLGLADIQLRLEDWPAVMFTTAVALERVPSLTRANYLRALASLQLNDWGESAQCLAAVLRSAEAGNYPMAMHLLAGAYAQSGNFPAAAVQLRTFLANTPSEGLASQARRLLANWETQGLIARAPYP